MWGPGPFPFFPFSVLAGRCRDVLRVVLSAGVVAFTVANVLGVDNVLCDDIDLVLTGFAVLVFGGVGVLVLVGVIVDVLAGFCVIVDGLPHVRSADNVDESIHFYPWRGWGRGESVANIIIIRWEAAVDGFLPLV